MPKVIKSKIIPTPDRCVVLAEEFHSSVVGNRLEARNVVTDYTILNSGSKSTISGVNVLAFRTTAAIGTCTYHTLY